MATGFHRNLAILLAGLLVAASDEPEELASESIHSDLPLFRDYETLWPKHFADGDDFGCTSRIRFGDWSLISGVGDDVETTWLRIDNYGVFHCAALVSESDERAGLDKATPRLAFFVELGLVRVGSTDLELWALQTGTSPGSDYLLLARERAPISIVKFTVLQRECPRGNYRNAGSIDIFGTKYCAINSGSELIALARKMSKRLPLGLMERSIEETPAVPGSEAATQEP